MMAAKKRSSMLDMCRERINKDNEIIKLQHELDQVIKTIKFIEQGFLKKEMNYFHLLQTLK